MSATDFIAKLAEAPARTRRAEKVAGGLVGLLVGDALGVPYEFHGPNDIPPAEQIEYQPPEGFRRSHVGTPPGTYSDDGAQALCLLDAILDARYPSPAKIAKKLVAWHDHGHLAVDRRVFDVGIQTSRSIARLKAGVPPIEAGGSDEAGNGNGSLMRVLPLALWHQGDDASLASDAMEQSRVTHGHPRAQVCCALHCLWARNTLEEAASPFGAALITLSEVLRGRYLDELQAIAEDPGPRRGTGYVVDSLHSARQVVQSSQGYAATVRAAIRLGNDTDTTAAIAGGIAGIRYGLVGIPKRWVEALRGREIWAPFVRKLAQRAARPPVQSARKDVRVLRNFKRPKEPFRGT